MPQLLLPSASQTYDTHPRSAPSTPASFASQKGWGLVWCSPCAHGWMEGWMDEWPGWMDYGMWYSSRPKLGVAPQRESTLPWLLSLGWCLRSEELWGVVLIHNFPISGCIPVYVAHLSGLGALSSVNGQLYITMHLFVYKKIYTVYCRNNAHLDIAHEFHN